MKHCEYYETALSTLIDGELEACDLLPAIDHVVDCSRCRDFYRDARSLERMVLAVAPSESALPASRDIWRRIDAATRPSTPPAAQPRWRRDWRTWGSAVAASVVLSFGLWAMLESGSPADVSTGGNGYIDVVLEQDRGGMSDRRFVELTAELLRADERYHRKMYQVMEMVTDTSTASEGTAEGGFRGELDDLVLEAVGEETNESNASRSRRLPV